MEDPHTASIRFALGRGDDFITVPEPAKTRRTDPDIFQPLPANGQMWSANPAEKDKQQKEALYSAAWVKDYIEKKKALARSPQNKFLIRVAGSVGIKDFRKLITPPDPAERQFRHTAQLKLLEDELRRRANLKPATVAQVKALKKERQDLARTIDTLTASSNSIEASSILVIFYPSPTPLLLFLTDSRLLNS